MQRAAECRLRSSAIWKRAILPLKPVSNAQIYGSPVIAGIGKQLQRAGIMPVRPIGEIARIAVELKSFPRQLLIDNQIPSVIIIGKGIQFDSVGNPTHDIALE